MATKCSRMMSRASISTLQSALKPNPRTSSSASSSSPRFLLPTRSTSSPLRRFQLSRCPSELGCMLSLLPLHSAVAAARMTSRLSSSSRSCRALSQGAIIFQSPGKPPQ